MKCIVAPRSVHEEAGEVKRGEKRCHGNKAHDRQTWMTLGRAHDMMLGKAAQVNKVQYTQSAMTTIAA